MKMNRPWFMVTIMVIEISSRNKKRGSALKNIVIVNSKPGPDEYLLALAYMLFRDCEIHVVYNMYEVLEQCRDDSYSDLFTADMTGRA